MHNINDFCVSAKVRIVLEGDVNVVNSKDRTITVGTGTYRNVIDPNADHVKSITTLSRPPKVGDVIGGLAALELPPGSVLKWRSEKTPLLVIACKRIINSKGIIMSPFTTGIDEEEVWTIISLGEPE